MSRRKPFLTVIFGVALLVAAYPALARVKVTKLAEKLLYGDQATRTQAVQEFNKLPADAQERLVPDFMVALSDDDPQVRKIASRILKAMGVSTGEQIPDAKKEVPVTSTATVRDDKWAEEKKLRDEATTDKWSDLKKMRGEEAGYADLKKQVELEKKGAVSLDAAQLQAEAGASTSVFSTVVESLKDPDPWVRAQAARRVGMIQPAPVEAIPTLIKMLSDKETESRRAAVAALGSFGHLAREAILPLNSALSDPDPAVRTLAADSLKLIQQRQ